MRRQSWHLAVPLSACATRIPASHDLGVPLSACATTILASGRASERLCDENPCIWAALGVPLSACATTILASARLCDDNPCIRISGRAARCQRDDNPCSWVSVGREICAVPNEVGPKRWNLKTHQRGCPKTGPTTTQPRLDKPQTSSRVASGESSTRRH